MTIPTPDRFLVRDRQRRFELEAAEHRLARRRPTRERTPDRAAARPVRLRSGNADAQRPSATGPVPPAAA